ncbi:carbon-nitrogen hydrolase family protein [Lichenifustis flavocetrariae]|uniref:Carbon-nitrogen hydrolase family protein n=1 Tax=Lichenifustis flavocetrariae TaxID=2949735 RepID=A0AA41Z319_9HYPH|nr:carbon-nitrogen hydrolase family protein [Lichenifustis flavocetrariae]MCW6512071.1 carbon-nitrogen hydrolase family protein [Lichenifustis flavocetrariae]
MRVGAFQRFSIFDDPGRAIEGIARDCSLADERGVDLALFPEAYLQGHAYDEGLIERRAVTLDGPVVGGMLRRLSGVKAVVIVGLFERRGSHILNSAVVIEGGRIVGVYAKAFPIEDGCVPGTDFPVWTRSNWTFGINICNDLNHPCAAERLTTQGARLIRAPINMTLRAKKADRWRVPTLDNLKDTARRSRCWLIAADVAGPGLDGWFSYGCTAIISPDGTVVGRSAELVEDMVIFDLP